MGNHCATSAPAEPPWNRARLRATSRRRVLQKRKPGGELGARPPPRAQRVAADRANLTGNSRSRGDTLPAHRLLVLPTLSPLGATDAHADDTIVLHRSTSYR